MCGIAGIHHGDGRPAEDGLLGPMLDRIAHRGPDGRGVFRDGPCALGHVRLAILDRTERAHQPMAVGDGVLVYNGEVYNFKALRAELEAEGARFTSTGDAQVVAEALHRWGPERATPRFDGMFAFAWLDRRDGSLWLARDRVGIKPLVFLRRGDTTLFCSEAKGLLAHPDVTPEADPRELFTFLASGRPSPVGSLMRGVETLPPGALYRIQGRRFEQDHFFDLAEALEPERLARRGRAVREEARVEFARRIRESVRGHLQSDVPVATLCSGGVDSSLVTALAAAELPSIEAWVADAGEPSEAPAAELVGRHVGIRVRRVRVDREAYAELWPEAVWYADGPRGHPSDAVMLAVARACRADGVEVLLTGEGSDEVFGGYDWYGRTHDLWREVRLGRRLPGVLGRPWQRLWHDLRNAGHDRELAFGDRRLRRLLAFALTPDQELRRKRLATRLGDVVRPEERAAHLSAYDDLYWHLAWILRRHDAMGMAASVETRLPFLGNDMLDLGIHLPFGLKRRRGVAKWVVRDLGRKLLPRQTITARKRSFPIDKRLFLGATSLLRGGVLPELLGWSRAMTEDLVPEIECWSRFGFLYAGLEIWGRIFLRGETPAEIGEALRKL